MSAIENPKSRRKMSRTLLLFLFLIIIIIVFVFFLKNPSQGSFSDEPKASKSSGERFEFDDFYHAKDGVWQLESTLHLLKEQKFVSGESELKEYLVYTANSNDTIRIKEASGRWKLIEVVENNSPKAIGWVDANRKNAKRFELLGFN